MEQKPNMGTMMTPAPAPAQKKPEPAAPKKGMNWVWVLIALLVLGGIMYFIGMKAEAPAPAPGDQALQEGEGDTVQKPGPSLSWEFAPAGGDPTTGAPKTQVMLVANGETRDLGVANGSCMIVDGSSGSWTLSEGEITGVICYFGGAGTEYGVFYDAGAYVVKKGVIDEGTAEEPGVRGNYEALFTI